MNFRTSGDMAYIGNTTIHMKDFDITEPVVSTNSDGNTSIQLYPARSGRRISTNAIDVVYDRLDISDVIDNSINIVVDDVYSDLLSIIGVINDGYGTDLVLNDVVNVGLPEVEDRGEYFIVNIEIKPNSYNYYGSTTLIVGDINIHKPVMSDSVGNVYLINNYMTNDDYDKSIIKIGDDKSWVFGTNIISTTLYEIEYSATMGDKIILKGSFSISYIEIGTGNTIVTTNNTLVINEEGMIENSHESNEGELKADTESSSIYVCDTNVNSCTVNRTDVEGNTLPGYPVVINEAISLFDILPGDGFVTVSKSKTVDGNQTVVIDKYTLDGIIDVNFNTVSINNMDVESDTIIDMFEIVDIDTSGGFIDLLTDTGIAPSVSGMTPLINGEEYITAEPGTYGIGWVPVIRLTPTGMFGINNTNFNPTKYTLGENYYWEEDESTSWFNRLSSTPDKIAYISNVSNHHNGFIEPNIMLFNGDGSATFYIDNNPLHNYNASIVYNFKVLPNDKLVVTGNFSKVTDMSSVREYCNMVLVIDLVNRDIDAVKLDTSTISNICYTP